MTLEPDFGKIGKTLITGLLDSPFMEMVGETIGFFVSELLTVMANLVTGVTDFATTSKFAKGFTKGLRGRLDEAGNKLGMGAFEAIRTIFDGVFKIMGKLLLTIVTKLPMETMLFVGITSVLPAALAALGTKIGMTLSAVLSNAGAMIQASLLGTKAATGAGAATTAAISGGTAHAALTGKAAPVAGATAAKTGMFAKFLPALAAIAKFLLPIALVLGAIVILGGGVENTMRQLQQIFGEIGHAVWGSVSGIVEVFGIVFGFIGDLGNGLGRLINLVPGVNLQLDLLKMALLPITAPLDRKSVV
jgi:hypothetical protein